MLHKTTSKGKGQLVGLPFADCISNGLGAPDLAKRIFRIRIGREHR